MAMTLLRVAAIAGVGGSLVAVAVPAFVKNLSASKWSEPAEALSRLSTQALAHAATHEHDVAFPPPAPLTPASIPRGERVVAPPDAWSHLSWRALGFSMPGAQAYAYRFDSALDPGSLVFSFAATAHGDLDGDGNASTFQVQGDKPPRGEARVAPGLLVAREVE
jgi:hypothetical protein